MMLMCEFFPVQKLQKITEMEKNQQGFCSTGPSPKQK